MTDIIHPKSIMTGVLLGTIECLVVDGVRMLTYRGAVRGLTSKNIEKKPGAGLVQKHRETDQKDPENLEKKPGAGGVDDGKLDRYVSRIPGQSIELSHRLIKMPAGWTAKCITVDQWTQILDAYSEAFLSGLINNNGQADIARTAIRLQRAAAHVGWTALVDEATGYQAVRPANALEREMAKQILRAPGEEAEWERMFPDELVVELCKLAGIQWTPGTRHPVALRFMYGWLYELALEKALAKTQRLQARDKGVKNHQVFTPQARAAFAKVLDKATYTATLSEGMGDFRHKMLRAYRGDPLQMSILTGVSLPQR